MDKNKTKKEESIKTQDVQLNTNLETVGLDKKEPASTAVQENKKELGGVAEDKTVQVQGSSNRSSKAEEKDSKKEQKEALAQKKSEERERKQAQKEEAKAKKKEEKLKKQEQKEAEKAKRNEEKLKAKEQKQQLNAQKAEEKKSSKDEKINAKIQAKIDAKKVTETQDEKAKRLEEQERLEHERLVKEFSASDKPEVYKFTVEKKPVEEKKPWWKHLVNVLVIVAIVAVVVVGGYVGYLQASYSRIIDNQALSVENNVAKFVEPGQSYSIMTYNIGFGAYSPEYTFFMDEGGYQNGKTTKGENSKAFSKNDVEANTTGAISVASKYSSDFYFFQEVDTESTRSYNVNQLDMLKSSFVNYGTIFAKNLHTAYLCYPLFNSIGKMNAGIATLSKYYAYYATRRSLPIQEGFVNKFFDLDRCISVTKIKIESSSNKFLVLINVHLSAYDDGAIRAEQLKMLYEIMDIEYNKNKNYVIVGGDFNHSIYGEKGVFANDMVIPSWLKQFPEGYDAQKLNSMGYTIALDQSAIMNKIGTCRDSSVAYKEGSTLEVVIDGFMVSANVKIDGVKVIDTNFEYSDHNPVVMNFTLI